MEAAVAELTAVQQETAKGLANPAKARKDASVAELARQLAEQLDARNKARIVKDNREPRSGGRGARQGLRGRELPRMRQLHPPAQRHLPQVRHLRRHQRLFMRVQRKQME